MSKPDAKELVGWAAAQLGTKIELDDPLIMALEMNALVLQRVLNEWESSHNAATAAAADRFRAALEAEGNAQKTRLSEFGGRLAASMAQHVTQQHKPSLPPQAKPILNIWVWIGLVLFGCSGWVYAFMT